MANILITDTSGNLEILQNGSTTPLPASPVPFGCVNTGQRPSSRVYMNRRYIVGQYLPGVCYDEYGNFTAMGVPPPFQPPTLAGTAPVGTGVTGLAIGYITFAYKIGPVIIAESNPTSPTGIISLTNQARLWTNLPTIPVNPKCNVIRGYVSMAGAVPLLAWERPIGTTSVTEQVPTVGLGSSLPVDDNGNLTFANGLPPPANFMEIYHDRAWYNDPTNLSYFWYSEIGEPEAVGALNFIQTRDREPVTAINKVNDVLVVQGQSVTYDMQGYTVVDFNLRKVTSSIGCIANATVVNINEVLWFVAQDGVWTYNGATFRYMMKKLATFFRTDYLANRALYGNAFAADDRYDNLYKLLLPVAGSETRPNYLVCPYRDTDPSMAGLYGSAPGSQGFGTEPSWHFDNRARPDFTMLSAVAPGTSRADFYTASSSDGFIRQENVESDATDDGDANQKTWSLTHGHNLLRKPGGDIMEGKRFHALDVFGPFENAGGTLYLWCGDENAGSAPIDQALALAVQATFQAGVVSQEVLTQKLTVAGATGRGYTLKISVPLAKGNEYRGHGMVWEPTGVQSRSPNT